jgi:hypothetical protein
MLEDVVVGSSAEGVVDDLVEAIVDFWVLVERVISVGASYLQEME